MTFDKWVESNLGKQIDYDGVSGVQCVDLVKHYIKNVLGVTPQSIGNAIEYYNKRKTSSYLTSNFTWKDNTASFIPAKGDIAVFGYGECGHISVCDGDGTTSYFYSYDQNWNGKAMKRVKHKYTAHKFLGVLRPKDQSNIVTEKTMYVKTDSKPLNVRKTASTGAKSLAQLPKGTKVVVTETSGSWSKISSPAAGWVSSAYLSSSKVTVTYKVKTSGGNLNCRAKASTTGSVTGKFKNGTQLTYQYKYSSSWYYVKGTDTKGNSITGYCKSSYLKMV